MTPKRSHESCTCAHFILLFSRITESQASRCQMLFGTTVTAEPLPLGIDGPIVLTCPLLVGRRSLHNSGFCRVKSERNRTNERSLCLVSSDDSRYFAESVSKGFLYPRVHQEILHIPVRFQTSFAPCLSMTSNWLDILPSSLSWMRLH